MCGLKPKDEFRLYALGTSEAAPAPSLPTPSSQMEEVRMLLQAHRLQGEAGPQAGADPRQQFMSALAHAALSQVRSASAQRVDGLQPAVLVLNGSHGIAQVGTGPSKGRQEQTASSCDANGMADSQGQPAASTAVHAGSTGSYGSDQSRVQVHCQTKDAPPDAPAFPQAGIYSQDSSAAEEMSQAGVHAGFLAAIDAAVERKVAELDVTAMVEREVAKLDVTAMVERSLAELDLTAMVERTMAALDLTAMVHAAVEEKMTEVEAQLPALAAEAVRKAFVDCLKRSRRQ